MEQDDPIPLSALEHWSYCPRQCCLIHAEQAFALLKKLTRVSQAEVWQAYAGCAATGA